MHRRRVWSEEVPFETLRSRPVLELCRRFDLEIIVAVRPGKEDELARVLTTAADAGVNTAVWPMLADASGRWANAGNADPFATFVDRIGSVLERSGAVLREIAIDLEPAIDDVRAAIAWPPYPLTKRRGAQPIASAHRREEGTRTLAALCTRTAARGVVISAALVPLLLLDQGEARASGATGREIGVWQTLLGTPIDALLASHVSVMLYTSIIEGWSHGLLDRAAVRELLGVTARATRARYGARAGLSLGAVGVGAFGNEPIYRSPDELADDVAIARAAGIDDLTLLDLGGVLARPTPEAWLAAFVETEAAAVVPAPGARSLAALGAMRIATRVAKAFIR